VLHSVLLERAAKVEDTVHSGNVRQERIAETFALGGSLHKAGNIGNLSKNGRTNVSMTEHD